MKRWILSLALLTLGFTASAQNDLIDRGSWLPKSQRRAARKWSGFLPSMV